MGFGVEVGFGLQALLIMSVLGSEGLAGEGLVIKTPGKVPDFRAFCKLTYLFDHANPCSKCTRPSPGKLKIYLFSQWEILERR